MRSTGTCEVLSIKGITTWAWKQPDNMLPIGDSVQGSFREMVRATGQGPAYQMCGKRSLDMRLQKDHFSHFSVSDLLKSEGEYAAGVPNVLFC